MKTPSRDLTDVTLVSEEHNECNYHDEDEDEDQNEDEDEDKNQNQDQDQDE